MDLKALYLATLAACDPERLMRDVETDGVPRNVVAIGKCAGALLDGFGDFDAAFVAIPEGYREPRSRSALVYKGGHPQMTAASFIAGRALLDFVDVHDDITFLISGGGSACVEVPLPPNTEQELIDRNRALIESGLPIGEINRVRRSLSAIKGGRLGERVRGRGVAFIYSDVSTGALGDVASGPVLRDMHLIADNTTLVRTADRLARERGLLPVMIERQIESDVEEAARFLAGKVAALEANEVLVAGGEPTVVVRGGGKGGRCSELAVRFAMAIGQIGQIGRIGPIGPIRPIGPIPLAALFASSDGFDGNSGVAGFQLRLPAPLDLAAAERELLRSNSFAVAERLGEAIMIPEAGNNLRDLYLLARG